MNLTQKILADHLISGELTPGEEISIRIDHKHAASLIPTT